MKNRATHAALTSARANRTTTICVLGPCAYETPTSTTVSTNSTKKMTRYCRARDTPRCAPVPVGDSLISATRGDQIDDGEDQDPDQIDEMPEQAQQLDLGGGRLLAQPAHERDQDVEGPAQHVRAVKAGDHVEGARICALAEDQTLLRQARVEDAEVLGVLADQEQRSAERRQGKEDRRAP